MGWNPQTLPDKVKRLLSPEDRKKLGEYGLTNEEALRRAEIKSERELQDTIAALLNLKGVKFIRSRMDKKTTNTVGTPDFLVALRYLPEGADVQIRVPLAMEVKLPGKDLDDDQVKMRRDMTAPPNGWRFEVVRSVDEVLVLLRRFNVY